MDVSVGMDMFGALFDEEERMRKESLIAKSQS